MKNLCRECGDGYFGRSDKVYCSDQCRTANYNRKNSDRTKFMRNVNNILRKNRRILAHLNPEGKIRVHKTKLIEEGFKFNYHTSSYSTKSGKTYFFCYEQGYIQSGSGYLALVIADMVALFYSLPETNRIDLANPFEHPEFYQLENRWDEGHLNDAGAKIYTQKLATAFSEQME